MAAKRRKSGASGGGGRQGAGLLGFGLSERDRSVPKQSRKRPKPVAKAAAKPKAGRKAAPRGKAPATKKARRGVFGAIGHGFRRTLHWAAVALIVSTVGFAGLVGYYFMKLPPTSEWALPKRPANVRIVSADGSLITNRGDTTGRSLRLSEMPEHVPEAVIAIEDRRFYYHFGVDPVGLVRAFVANWNAGGVVQGGSTLTQQLAKNLFLKPERSFERKVQEVILAVWLEASLSKAEILELYLNRVYLGAGAYGVDAAAHRYFGKSARDLTVAEAATIAGLLKAPSRYSPLIDADAASGRAQLVIRAMREEGYIDDRAAATALAEDVKPVRDIAGGSGRYVADWVMDQLPDLVGAIDSDVIVETTIDLRLQAAAARAVTATLAADKGEHRVSQGAFVALSPDGAVQALVGGRDYATSPFNRAVDARRQPGSAFKPFVYLAALENGFTPETVRVDRPVTVKGWTPENYTRKYLGPITLAGALSLSLNTVAAEVTAEIGAKAVATTARRLGIRSPLLASPSLALGTSEVGLLELTAAFAPFANGGYGVIPHVVRRIVAADGKTVLYERAGSGKGRVIEPLHVGMMNMMLRETVERGTGKRAAIPGWAVAGKTGTSQDFRDAWFVGYTGVLVAGAWFGNDDNRPTKKASGSTLPADAFRSFMETALDGVPVVALPGNYRFGTPGRPQESIPAALFTEGGEPLHDPVVTNSIPARNGAPPIPPADVGAAGQPPPKKGFFRRLFGG